MSHLLYDQGIWLTGIFLARPLTNSALLGAFTVFAIFAIDYLNHQRKRRQLGGVPLVGDVPLLWRRLHPNPLNYRAVLQSGYEKFSKQSKPFAVWQQNDEPIIILPPGTEEEIKNVGPDRLSFLHAVDHVSQSHTVILECRIWLMNSQSYHFWLHTKILGRSHIEAVRILASKHLSL